MKNPCVLEANVNKIISNFTLSDQVLVQQLYQKLVVQLKQVVQQGLSNLKANQSQLFASFQTNDPNGFANLQALGAVDLTQSCNSTVSVVKNFLSSLNSKGKLIVEKIGCYLHVALEKSIPAALSQFYIQNSNSLTVLMNNEGKNFSKLIDMFKETFMKH